MTIYQWLTVDLVIFIGLYLLLNKKSTNESIFELTRAQTYYSRELTRMSKENYELKLFIEKAKIVVPDLKTKIEIWEKTNDNDTNTQP